MSILLASPIVDDMLTNVRTMLGQPSNVNSTWSDEELTTYLNEAVRRYFMEVVTNSEGQFAGTANLDIVSGVETIALPSDFFKAKALFIARGDGSFDPLEYRNNLTESYTTTGSVGSTTYTPYYYFRGNNLVLRDVPQFSQTGALLLEYIAFPQAVVSGGDTLVSPVAPVFRDLIEAYAVYKAKLRESLANGVNTYAAAKENVNDLYLAMKECITPRSNNPTYVVAFNPETY